MPYQWAVDAFRQAITPLQVTDDLIRCLKESLDHACISMQLHPDAISAMAVNELKPAERSVLLTADVTHPSARSWWTACLRESLLRSETLDMEGVDIFRFSELSFDRYVVCIKREAAKPGSRLHNAVTQSYLSSLHQKSQERSEHADPGIVSNLDSIPAPHDMVHRRAVDDAIETFDRHAVVQLVGGPGMGKSTVARMVADHVRLTDVHVSVWWMDGTTPESLEASCAELCHEFSLPAGDNMLRQAKSLIASGREWFIIIDNLSSDTCASDVLPSSNQWGRALITARAPVAAHPDSTIALRAADGELMQSIAASAIESSLGDRDFSDVIDACKGNPLALATTCAYVAATGASAADVLDLLRAHPDVVLSEPLGAHYPATFSGVIRQSLATLGNAVATDILAVIVLAGGSIRRADLSHATGASKVDLHAGLRALNRRGLVEFSDDRVNSHALICSLAARDLTDSHLRSAAGRMFTTIEERISDADDLQLREYVRIADRIRTFFVEGVENEFSARLGLAKRLSGYGLGRTAQQQIELAAERLEPQMPLDRLDLMTTRCMIQFQRGNVRDAEALALQVIKDVDPMLHKVDPAGVRPILVNALLCAAFSRAYFNDQEAAARFAAHAQKVSGNDPAVTGARLNLAISTLKLKDRLPAFLEVAHDEGLSPASRAEAFTRASRAAGELERHEDAIHYAREACRIDGEETGTRTQMYARDLNDLGMALLAVGDFEEAESCLRASISIYSEEIEDHGFEVSPRLHLGRVLADKALREPEDRGSELRRQALDVLAPALTIQRRLAPETPEMAALLVAQANATEDHAAAIRLLEEAVSIDIDAYGTDHPEVCIDSTLLASRLLHLDRAEDAVKVLDVPKPYVVEWETTRPARAVEYLCIYILALSITAPRAFGRLEIESARNRIRSLRPLVSESGTLHDLIETALQI